MTTEQLARFTDQAERLQQGLQEPDREVTTSTHVLANTLLPIIQLVVCQALQLRAEVFDGERTVH